MSDLIRQLIDALELMIEYAQEHAVSKRTALEHPRNKEMLDGMDDDIKRARAVVEKARNTQSEMYRLLGLSS